MPLLPPSADSNGGLYHSLTTTGSPLLGRKYDKSVSFMGLQGHSPFPRCQQVERGKPSSGYYCVCTCTSSVYNPPSFFFSLPGALERRNASAHWSRAASLQTSGSVCVWVFTPITFQCPSLASRWVENHYLLCKSDHPHLAAPPSERLSQRLSVVIKRTVCLSCFYPQIFNL